MATLQIDMERCKGCSLCVQACPKKILALSAKQINSKGYRPAECTDMVSCTACAACARMCPDSCIEIDK